MINKGCYASIPELCHRVMSSHLRTRAHQVTIPAISSQVEVHCPNQDLGAIHCSCPEPNLNSRLPQSYMAHHWSNHHTWPEHHYFQWTQNVPKSPSRPRTLSPSVHKFKVTRSSLDALRRRTQMASLCASEPLEPHLPDVLNANGLK